MDAILSAKNTVDALRTARIHCNTSTGRAATDTTEFPCDSPFGTSTKDIDAALATSTALLDKMYNQSFITPRLREETRRALAKKAAVDAKYRTLDQVRAADATTKASDLYPDMLEREREVRVRQDINLLLAAVASGLLVYTFFTLRRVG